MNERRPPASSQNTDKYYRDYDVNGVAVRSPINRRLTEGRQLAFAPVKPNPSARTADDKYYREPHRTATVTATLPARENYQVPSGPLAVLSRQDIQPVLQALAELFGVDRDASPMIRVTDSALAAPLRTALDMAVGQGLFNANQRRSIVLRLEEQSDMAVAQAVTPVAAPAEPPADNTLAFLDQVKPLSNPLAAETEDVEDDFAGTAAPPEVMQELIAEDTPEDPADDSDDDSDDSDDD